MDFHIFCIYASPSLENRKIYIYIYAKTKSLHFTINYSLLIDS